MPKEILFAQVKQQGQKVILLSPKVGRIALLCTVGDYVGFGRVIAHLSQLNRRYAVKLPQDCAGTVVQIKDRHRIVDVAYNEPFLELDATDKDTSAVVKIGDVYDKHEGLTVDSPMDGMFYLSPSPDSPAFVKVGDEIVPGQTLGLIEVMKCFYPLKYQGSKRAKIKAINIRGGSSVNCGTSIFSLSE